MYAYLLPLGTVWSYGLYAQMRHNSCGILGTDDQFYKEAVSVWYSQAKLAIGVNECLPRNVRSRDGLILQ
jgi:hypothetical protein